jgi:hypothetical protein
LCIALRICARMILGGPYLGGEEVWCGNGGRARQVFEIFFGLCSPGTFCPGSVFCHCPLPYLCKYRPICWSLQSVPIRCRPRRVCASHLGVLPPGVSVVLWPPPLGPTFLPTDLLPGLHRSRRQLGVPSVPDVPEPSGSPTSVPYFRNITSGASVQILLGCQSRFLSFAGVGSVGVWFLQSVTVRAAGAKTSACVQCQCTSHQVTAAGLFSCFPAPVAPLYPSASLLFPCHFR